MATVSDLISIQLSIDTSGVSQGGQQATTELDRIKARLTQQSNDVERIAKDIGASVGTALKYVAGLMGVVLTFEGFKSLVKQFTDSNTALGRFSEAVGVAVERVGELEQGLGRFGARSGDVRSAIAQIRTDQVEAQMKGTVPEWAQMLGRAPFRMNTRDLLVNKSPDEVLMDVSKAAKGMDPYALKQFLPGLNLDPTTLSALTKPDEMQRLINEVRRGQTAPTGPQTEAAERLKEKWATLEDMSSAVLRDLITIAEPLLAKILDNITYVMSWLDQIERKVIGTTSPATSPGAGPSGMVGAPTFGGFRPRRTERVTTSPGAAPTSAPGGASSATHIGGTITVEGKQYTYGSGGAGYASIPTGDYPITPGTIGPWGQAHGAMGINNNRIWDSRLGRYREGIEFHSGSSDALITEGCVAIAGKQWPQFKAQVLEMIRTHGSAFLHIGPDGASVTPGSIANGNVPPANPSTSGGYSTRGSTFNDLSTASGMSAKTTSGIALPSGGKMGDWYEVTTPDGRKFVTRLIDRGPATWTGRGVDISEQLAREMGYDPNNFPTDKVFKVAPISTPINIPNVDTGAGAAVRSPGPRHESVSNESTTSINHVTVHTNATDAGAIAKDIKEELGRQLVVPQPSKDFGDFYTAVGR